MKSICLFAILFVTTIGLAQPEFVGMLSSEQWGSRFVVATEPGAAPRWLKIGEQIAGYSLNDFRSQEEALVFKKDGREFLVKLNASKVLRSGYRGQPLSFAAARQ